jgi:hypothetical protein
VTALPLKAVIIFVDEEGYSNLEPYRFVLDFTLERDLAARAGTGTQTALERGRDHAAEGGDHLRG